MTEFVFNCIIQIYTDMKKSRTHGVLSTVPTDEIVEELKRRISAMDEAKAMLAAVTYTTTTSPKNSNVSRAKEAYWRRRREWLATNPGKTIEDFYKENRRIVTFDTSVHNLLTNIGTSAGPIYRAVRSRYFFRLAGLSFEEMMSTPEASDRLALLDGCRQLATGRSWDCLNPPHEVLRILVVAYVSDPANFRWLAVDVRSGGIAYEIRQRELVTDDAMASLQRIQQNASLKAYKAGWVTLRKSLDRVFTEQDIPRPKTFEEAFRNASSKLFPGIAKGLYDAALRFDAKLRGEEIKPDTDMATVQRFVDRCPPFRAAVCAFLMSWYNTSLREGNTSEKFAAGRNDLFMAVYLPYCDVFVTGEKHREQERCLQELTKYIGIETEVIGFDAFRGEL